MSTLFIIQRVSEALWLFFAIIQFDPILPEPLGLFAVVVNAASFKSARKFMGVGFSMKTDDFAARRDFGLGE